MSGRATVDLRRDHVVKTFQDPADLERELKAYHLLPWACPRLLDHDESSLTVERLTVALTILRWRPYEKLRELLLAVHRLGVHHRDVHVKNVVRARDDRPLLIDWEFAIWWPSDLSYDLVGPHRSGVPIPEAHKHLIPQWWGSTEPFSIANRWGGRARRAVSTRVASRPGGRPGTT